MLLNYFCMTHYLHEFSGLLLTSKKNPWVLKHPRSACPAAESGWRLFQHWASGSLLKMKWAGRPKSLYPERKADRDLGNRTHKLTAHMLVQGRAMLWAMLVLQLVAPWSTGYHHPYHHSPKIQPWGTLLHFSTIHSSLRKSEKKKQASISSTTN